MTVPFSSGVRTYVYDCPGKRMIVSFDDRARTASVSRSGEPLYVLSEYSTEGEFAYADATNSLRGNRNEVRWTAGRDGPITCYARPQGS